MSNRRRPQYVFRPDLTDPLQRQAWDLLQQVPSSDRRCTVALSIVQYHDRCAMESCLRKLLREELDRVAVSTGKPGEVVKTRAPAAAVDFLATLQKS